MTTSFKLLKELVYRLSKTELLTLKQKLIGSKKNNFNLKSIRLLEIIIDNPDISERETVEKIYKDEINTAFLRLVTRMIEKIDEVYLNLNYDLFELYSERNYQFFNLKRKLLILQMRWLRGVPQNLEFHFEKIISQSKKYELYETLIEVLLIKQRYVGFRFGKKAFEKIETEIRHLEENRNAVQRARSTFNKVGTKINQSAYLDDYKEELSQSIIEIKKDYAITNSARVGYYFYFLESEWLYINGEYEAARDSLEKLLKLVLKKNSLYTKITHGDILLNLSNIDIHLKNFALAIENIRKAEKLYDAKSLNYDLAREIEFYAQFHSGKMNLAEEIIEEIYHSSRISDTPFQFSKRAFLFACLQTLKGEIEKSNDLLLDVKEIEKDKEGWNIAIRILTIINRIQAKDFESADLHVLNLEKFIKRRSKFRHVRKRDTAILRILLKLINENYDFKKVYNQRKRYFDLLESDDPEYRWKIKSTEMIVFHEWFRKKVDEQELSLRKRSIA